jgi:catechol 2,3-dioxygenase-like lactoylglutathione lyase family enzyme
MRIDHINIAAPMQLLEKVRDFYCKALLLEEGPRPDFGIPGFWLYGDGKPILHLIESNEHHRAAKPHYLDHVAFEVDDLQAYTERLDQLGPSTQLITFTITTSLKYFAATPAETVWRQTFHRGARSWQVSSRSL